MSLCEIDVVVLPKGSKQLWENQIQEFKIDAYPEFP